MSYNGLKLFFRPCQKESTEYSASAKLGHFLEIGLGLGQIMADFISSQLFQKNRNSNKNLLDKN